MTQRQYRKNVPARRTPNPASHTGGNDETHITLDRSCCAAHVRCCRASRAGDTGPLDDRPARSSTCIFLKEEFEQAPSRTSSSTSAPFSFDDMVNDWPAPSRPAKRRTSSPSTIRKLRCLPPAAAPRSHRLLAESTVIKPEDYFPGPLSSVTWDGKIYGVPAAPTQSRSTTTTTCSRRKVSIRTSRPGPGTNFTQPRKKLNDPAKNVYGLAFSAVAKEEGTFQFLPWPQMAGGDYDKINTEGGVKALNFWGRSSTRSSPRPIR